MKLLVSVRDAIEASAALEGGADIVDAKDPATGALGAVTLEAFGEIHSRVAGQRPVTAALGDANDEADLARTADAFVRGGATLVKVGFSGIASRARIQALVAAATDGAADRAGVIATAYADAAFIDTIEPFAVIDAASRAGAIGVLLDTANKRGPGLPELMPAAVLRAWVGTAREARLLVAVAGKLTANDLGYVGDAGADVVGVRGAVCDVSRTGRVVAARVRELRSALTRRSTLVPVPDPRAVSE